MISVCERLQPFAAPTKIYNKKQGGLMPIRLAGILLAPVALLACADVRETGAPGCLPCDAATALIFDSSTGSIVVNVPNKCVKPDSVLEVTLKKADPSRYMRTVADAGNPDNPGPANWLNQTERNGKISIRVPPAPHFLALPACKDLDWGCTFNYHVEEFGGASLDPRVTVKKMEKC